MNKKMKMYSIKQFNLQVYVVYTRNIIENVSNKILMTMAITFLQINYIYDDI